VVEGERSSGRRCADAAGAGALLPTTGAQRQHPDDPHCNPLLRLMENPAGLTLCFRGHGFCHR
jgi:hypothetical protein